MHVAKGLYRIPLMFFALAACFGLLLRWHVVHPLDWVHYPYMLHAHSHLMFLGWVTNALVVFGIDAYVADTNARWYRRVFYCLQALLVGMSVSFPRQGYGVASIVLSTLHTVLIEVLSIRFFRDTKSSASTASLWYMLIALVY